MLAEQPILAEAV